MSRRAGFTVMEVMVAIGVMTVGVMAIIGMQVQAQRQNQLAREYLMATQFAQSWSERLKMDALRWTVVPVLNGTPSVTTAFQPTDYLGTLIVGTGQSFLPLQTATSNFYKGGATYQGYDVPGPDPLVYTDPVTGTRTHRFCADARVAWVYFGRAIRADVRVYWPKPYVASFTDDFPGCADGADKLRPGTGTLVKDYHVVYVPNVLRVTELRGG